MDMFDAAVAECVCRTLTEAEVGLDDVCERLGIDEEALRDRLSARRSFTLEELASVAEMAGCLTVDLLPGVVR